MTQSNVARLCGCGREKTPSAKRCRHCRRREHWRARQVKLLFREKFVRGVTVSRFEKGSRR